MGHWVAQNSEVDKGKDYSGSIIRTFEADAGAGEAEAIAQGYVIGATETVDGRSWRITARRVQPQNAAYELVLVTLISPQGTRSRSGIKYRDGRIREDGDEEWTMSGNLSGSATWYKGRIQDTNANGFYPSDDLVREWQVPNKGPDAVAWDGVLSTAQAKEGGATPRGTQIRQPAAGLTWKKWMNKDSLGVQVATVPTNKTEALAMMATYLPNGSGSYETGAPRLMHVLGGGGNGDKLLCTDIRVYPDGDLVCREAIFEWNADGWRTGTAEPYGA